MMRNALSPWLPFSVGVLMFACGESDSGTNDATGGATNTGGTVSKGGSRNTGGSSGSDAVAGGGAGGSISGSGSGGTSANAGSSGADASGGNAGDADSTQTASLDVLTRSNDNHRSGANLKETILNTSNVNKDQFGKLYELPVDDEVYAQVLYVSNLEIKGGTHNVIYAATVNNTVYAFDADTKSAPLWQRNFNGSGRPTKNTEVGGACKPYRDFSGNIGIVGTPVIDRTTYTMYFVTRTVEASGTVQTLRAIDIRTGENKPNGSMEIKALVKGTGSGSVGGDLTFDPTIHNQRMSLGLSQGAIYIGWAAFCDTDNFHGWAMAYDATTLTQLGVLNSTPNAKGGGIWQAGAAPVIDDAGNVYLATGNGAYNGGANFSQSVLKLAPKTLVPLDHFAPSNWNSLNGGDLDLGSAGPTLIPGTNKIVLAGKGGNAYLLDTSNMGKSVAGDAQVADSFELVDPTVRPAPGTPHHLHNTVVVWETPQGLNMYASGENDYLRAWRFDRSSNKFNKPAVAVSSWLPPPGMPGGMLTISADGSKGGTGIVWATTPRADDANNKVTPGVLSAYDAVGLRLLWQSTSIEDDTHTFAKFNNPTVVNGKVYVASFANVLSVYGLKAVTHGPNLALNKPAKSLTALCNAQEGPEKAVNGTVNGGATDKWCSNPAAPAPKTLQVDLGSSVMISTVVIQHAGVAEGQNLDTSDFQVQISTDGVVFTTVADAKGNTMGVTTHVFAATQARYVRLNITKAEQDKGEGAARIYELEVYAP